PEQFSLSKQTDWKNQGIRLQSDWTEPEYLSTSPARLDLEVFFDAFEELFGDVSTDVGVLMDWTKPGPSNKPPLLEFRWGVSNVLQGMKFYLESVNATYTLFRVDGTPIRATCRIVLMEWSNPAHRQNPTSGGLPGLETHVLIDGETLHSVAWARYGEPTYWRAIADFNGIDDPMRVEPGTTLLIPPRRDAAALAS
ncbi:MAG TPA: LysM peptidoglycan-binding domain-containing protein, partial [Candidatus Limnocylindrales bacterium]|nr:LysM peptidoglycan-binding domain-containing protein [Candidatus Limnocylindrales bacterium]